MIRIPSARGPYRTNNRAVLSRAPRQIVAPATATVSHPAASDGRPRSQTAVASALTPHAPAPLERAAVSSLATRMAEVAGATREEIIRASASKPVFLVAGAPSCQGKSTIMRSLLGADDSLLGPIQTLDHHSKVAPSFKRWFEAHGAGGVPAGEFADRLAAHEPDLAGSDALRGWLRDNQDADGCIGRDVEAVLAAVKEVKQRWVMRVLLQTRQTVIVDTRATNADAICHLAELARTAGYHTVLLSVTVNDEERLFTRWYERNQQPDKRKGLSDLKRIYGDIRTFSEHWDRLSAAFSQGFVIANDSQPHVICRWHRTAGPRGEQTVQTLDARAMALFRSKAERHCFAKRVAALPPGVLRELQAQSPVPELDALLRVPAAPL